MKCEALIQKEYEGKKYEDVCGNTNSKICDMCEKYLCDKHSKEMDGDSAKHHFHVICWESRIFQMFRRKKDIPKLILGVCERCIEQGDKLKPKTQLFKIKNKVYENVCGLCKSELLDGENSNE